MTTTVAIYIRQSLDRTGERPVDRQREPCKRLCEARGWTIVAEYVDNSVSATNGTRPEWTRMLRDAESGRFHVILAWSLDRITRSMKDTEQLVALCERNSVRVATVSGDLDLTTDQGRLVGRILSAVARGEIERKSERQRLANGQAAANGEPPVGPRAVGWERDGVTLVPGEAEIVRRGFEMILAGRSLRGVARMWNANGLRTSPKRPRHAPKDAARVGQPWAPYSVRGGLTNPRYAGSAPSEERSSAWGNGRRSWTSRRGVPSWASSTTKIGATLRATPAATCSAAWLSAASAARN